MALPVREQLKYWGIAAAIFLFVLWLLGNVILPFVLGGAIAYFLDPVADWLQRHGFSRLWATVVITFVALLVFVLLALLVMPTLVNQATALVERRARDRRQPAALPAGPLPAAWSSEDRPSATRCDDLGQTIQSRGGELVNGLLASAGSLVNVLVLLVIVPVVTFYLLLDWDRMVAEIDALLPRDHAPTIRRLAREIDAHAGRLHPRPGHGLPDPRHLLRRGADGGGAAVRPGRGR